MDAYWIQQLQQALKGTLPGEAAQHQMASTFRLGKMPRCKPNSRTRQSSVLILLHPSETGWAFPLIKRPDYPGVHGGQIALPGGRHEPQDPDLIATALRETHEEIGVPPQHIQLLGQLSPLFVFASNNMVWPVLGMASSAPKMTPEPAEVDYIIPAAIELITHKAQIRQTTIQASETIELDAPYFDIDGHVVWGATAMILSELRALMLREGLK